MPSDWAAVLSRFLCAVVFSALACAPANAGRADWLVETLTGSVLVETDRAWVPLHQDDRVPLGAFIKTGRESEIQISRREARLNVAPETKVQFVAGANAKTITIAVESGLIGLNLREAPPNGFRVRTPRATMTAMIGKFAVAADRDGSAFAVRRGSARVASPKEKTQADIKTGQAARYNSEYGLFVTTLADDQDAGILDAAADKAAGGAPEPSAASVERAGGGESPAPTPSPPAESVATPVDDARPAEDPPATGLPGDALAWATDLNLSIDDPRFEALRIAGFSDYSAGSNLSIDDPLFQALRQAGLGDYSAAAGVQMLGSALPAMEPSIAGFRDVMARLNFKPIAGADVEDPSIASMQKGGVGMEPAAEVGDEPDAETPTRKAKINVGAVAAVIEDMAAEGAELDASDQSDAAQQSGAAPSHKAAIKHKHARRAPAMLQMRLFTALSLLDPSAAALLGVMLLMATFVTGGLVNAILGAVGFGTFGNSALALIGAATGAIVRDALFFSDFWFRYEPNVSVVSIVGFALASLIAACAAKARWLANQGSSRAGVSLSNRLNLGRRLEARRMYPSSGVAAPRSPPDYPLPPLA